MPLFNHVVGRAAPILSHQGYRQIIPNIVEPKSTFEHSLGLSSDIVRKEMYSFTDLGGNELVLRPEGTAGVMRWAMNSEYRKTIEKEPIKAYYWGPMYRYERPQAGRYRQFYQLGAERIGGSADVGSAILGDYENLSTALAILESIFEHKVELTVRMNNLGDGETVPRFNADLKSLLEARAGELSSDSQMRLAQGNCMRVLDSNSKQDQTIVESMIARGEMPSIDDYMPAEHVQAFEELITLLRDAHPGIEFVRDPALVRGLDYYNGACFEVMLADQ